MSKLADKNEQGQEEVDESPVGDRGWTSGWILSGGQGEPANRFITQSKVVLEGDMAMESGGASGTNGLDGGLASLDRYFPRICSGIVSFTMHVRLAEMPRADLLLKDNIYAHKPYIPATEPYKLYEDERKLSSMKVYLSDDGSNWAFRWHYPFAWWEIDGNDRPRFYICESKGRKKKGMDYTDFFVESQRWYKVSVILDFTAKTWEFWVDDVKFDAMKSVQHELAWWHDTAYLSRLRISSNVGKNWIDAITIRHNGKLVASTSFNSSNGYEDGKSIEGRGSKSVE